MICELMFLAISCAFVFHLVGCAGKERPNAGGGHSQNSVSIQPKVDPPKASKALPPQSKKEASAMNAATKSKVGDDGGYEACPDMTPSELAKAANVQSGA